MERLWREDLMNALLAQDSDGAATVEISTDTPIQDIVDAVEALARRSSRS